MSYPLRIFGLISVILLSASGEKTSTTTVFTAVSPKTIRENSDYNVYLAVEPVKTGTGSPTSFHLEINCSSTVFKGEGESIFPGKSAVITIPIKTIPDGWDFCNFTIASETPGEAKGLEYVIIHVNRKESSILIQTDKPIYKPGETVFFRVVLLNRHLRPIDKETVNITITDPQKNVIQNWREVPVQGGLRSSNITLSKEPNLGNWRIQVSFKNEQLERTFSVDQYVLPKFKVEVKLPPFASHNASTIIAEVRATYTYGKPISGNCTIKLSESYRYYYRPEIGTPTGVSRTLTLTNGVGFVEFNILKDLVLEPNFHEKEFRVDASVTETLTGREQNGTSSIKVYKYPYKIEKINTQESSKPGFPVVYQFKVSTQDNIPIADERPDAVQISHGYSYDDEHSYFNSSLPSNGIVTLNVTAPTNELNSPNSIVVTYKQLTTNFYPPQKIQSPTKTYMQITLQTTTLKFGSPIQATLTANKPFVAMNYLVFSRGSVLNFEKFTDLSAGKLEHNFEFVVPKGRAGPEAKLIVYGTFPGHDEIIADSVKLNFGPVPLDNYLNITLSEKRAEPGQNITLNLRSNSRSTIAIKAVDQSVLLLKEDNDITEDSIQNEIKNSNYENERHRVWGGSNAFQVFEEAGLVIHTNGDIRRERQYIPGNYGHGWGSYHATSGQTALLSNKVAQDAPAAAAFRPSTPAPQRKKIAGQAGGGGGEIRVRKDFPETWIWEDIFSLEEDHPLTKTVPDTLTSWIITGFSLHNDHGIGVNLAPQTLETFRPFFLSLNLPYSIVKGEVFPLQVLVHNYLGQNASDVEITLQNKENHFDFVDDKEKGLSEVTKKVSILNGEVGSVTFVIVPSKFGILKLDVKGVTSIAGDALSQPLRVKPPGHKETRNQAILLDLRSGNDLEKQSITAQFPEQRVPDADELKITVIGDLLGASVTNLDNLIQLPVGCGEQNMLNFVPDIVVLDYLGALEIGTPEIKAKATRFLETGYQKQLTYMHPDGSFSAFGNSDGSGSTWLTAFVIKSFAAAKKYITIDENIINHGVDFLIRQQQKDGEFIEIGRVIHSDLQGGSSGSGLALTSYVVLSLIEVSKIYSEINPKINDAIKNGLEYISVKYPAAVKNPYALNLASYTFHLANHTKKDEIFNLVEQQAKFQDDLKFWEKSDQKVVISKENATAILKSKDTKSSILPIWHQKMKPVSVEMTSYALMTYLIRGKVTESVPITRWLLRQRNPQGGFLSTQDTVVGLTALARFAVLIVSPNTNLKIQGTHDGNTTEISVNKENSLVLQEFFIPGTVRTVDFSAQGKGSALAQLSWSYYVEGPALQSFDLRVEVLKHDSPGTMQLKICNSFISPEPSNMAVMEIDLPSGYYFDTETAGDVIKVEGVRRHELDQADTKLNVYFNSFTNSSTCITVSANRVFEVANLSPASVVVYDYYDNTRRGIAFYSAPEVSICDICKDEKACKVKNCV